MRFIIWIIFCLSRALYWASSQTDYLCYKLDIRFIKREPIKGFSMKKLHEELYDKDFFKVDAT